MYCSPHRGVTAELFPDQYTPPSRNTATHHSAAVDPAHPVVATVGDIDIAERVHGDPGRAVELGRVGGVRQGGAIALARGARAGDCSWDAVRVCGAAKQTRGRWGWEVVGGGWGVRMRGGGAGVERDRTAQPV